MSLGPFLCGVNNVAAEAEKHQIEVATRLRIAFRALVGSTLSTFKITRPLLKTPRAVFGRGITSTHSYEGLVSTCQRALSLLADMCTGHFCVPSSPPPPQSQ